MSAASASRDSEPEARLYIKAVLEAYVSLPGMPDHASRGDRRLARALYARRVPLAVVRAAFLLAVARRTLRSTSGAPLGPVRTLFYFLPAIEEVLDRPLEEGYVQYLAHKLAPWLRTKAKEASVDSG